MVREFKLINEKNEEFSLMDIKNYCLLTNPAGFGYSYKANYEQIGNTFVDTLRNLNQGQISGNVNFINYDNFLKFVNFIEKSKQLRIAYLIPFKGESQTYYRDIEIEEVTKSEIQPNGVLSETISINCLGLWYQQIENEYSLGDQDIIWDFEWDPYFGDYQSRSIVVDNDGHVEAPFQIVLSNYIRYPKIKVLVDGIVINSIQFPFILQNGEKLMYSSKDNDIYIKKQNVDGTFTNLFNSEYIDINNTNIFKLPKGECELNVSAENDIFDGEIEIYKRYKVV